MRRLSILALLVLPNVVYGQLAGILSLSDACNKALGQLAIGSQAACLNTVGLINVLTTPSGQSWVGPFDNYLTTTCSQPACTVDNISSVISSLKEGCSTDLAAKGWSADDIETILQQASGYYPAAREVMCLRDTANGQKLCITTTLSNIEAMVGQPLNIGTIVAKTPTVLSSHSIDIPQNISCTPCTQGAYTLARPNLPSSSSVQAWDNFWIKQCGENFISGTLPASITQSANETTATSTPAPVSNAAALAAHIPPFAAVLGSLALMAASAVRVLHT